MQHVEIFKDVNWLKLFSEFNSNQNPSRNYLEDNYLEDYLYGGHLLEDFIYL